MGVVGVIPYLMRSLPFQILRRWTGKNGDAIAPHSVAKHTERYGAVGFVNRPLREAILSCNLQHKFGWKRYYRFPWNFGYIIYVDPQCDFVWQTRNGWLQECCDFSRNLQLETLLQIGRKNCLQSTIGGPEINAGGRKHVLYQQRRGNARNVRLYYPYWQYWQ